MTIASRHLPILAVVGAVWLAGCGRPSGPPKALAKAEKPRSVRVVPAEMRPMERTIAVSGTLAPQEESTLSVKVAGRVQLLAVDIGSLVRRGELIAQIEPRDYELRLQQAAAALAQARAALGLPLEGDKEQIATESLSVVQQAKAVLDEAAKTLERVRSLTQARIASASELDTAEAAYKVALTRYEAALEEGRARLATLAQRQAELEIARKQLADTSVTAPFDGAIQSRPAAVGEYVAPGTAVASLVKTDPLRLRLEVPERAAMLVRAGQLVRLRVGDTNVFSGRIARLSPALNEGNRMLLVEADVPNPGALRAGLFAKAEIVVNESQAGVNVPASALVTFAGIEKVLTIESGRVLEKPVTTGRRGPGWVEILSGISRGARVVLDPGGLRSGQLVVIAGTTEHAEAPTRKPELTRGQ